MPSNATFDPAQTNLSTGGCFEQALSLLRNEAFQLELMEWPLRLALRVDHPLAQHSCISREALLDETFILYVGSDVEQDRSLVQKILGFAPRVTYEVRSAFSLVSLVGAGLSVAIVPSSVSSISAGEQIVYRPIAGNTIEFATDVVFLRDSDDPAVTNFLQIVRADQP